MNQEKLRSYELHSSIHTFSVRSNNQPIIPNQISSTVVTTAYMAKTNTWITRVNPNKFSGGDVFAYSEFMALANSLFNSMNIPDYTYWRTDIRLDSYEDNFKDYYKLNLLLINLFSMIFNDTNGEAIGHMLMCTKELTDISTRNQYWEVKYYNKKFQTHDSDRAKARLEFRCLKSMVGHPPHEIKEIWFKKLDEIIPLYDELQEMCNKRLYIAYKEYCLYNGNAGNEKDMLTRFLSVYSHGMTLFSRKQARAFFEMCGVEKSKINDRVEYICDITQIEFFSNNDLKNYVEKIKLAMNDFFDC